MRELIAIAFLAQVATLAPQIYRVQLETTKGSIVIEVHRDWAPYGADRFYDLVTSGYYDDARFFRVVNGCCECDIARCAQNVGSGFSRTYVGPPEGGPHAPAESSCGGPSVSLWSNISVFS